MYIIMSIMIYSVIIVCAPVPGVQLAMHILAVHECHVHFDFCEVNFHKA